MTPPSVPTSPPTELVAGSSAVWDDTAFVHPDYGVFRRTDGWALTYTLVGPIGAVTLTGATQDDGWRTTLTSAQSTSLWDSDTSGEQLVRWTAFVSSGSDRIPVAYGTMVLSADPAAQTSGFLSDAAIELKAAKAARARGLVAYSIGGRAFTYASAADLNRRIARLEYQVWQEAHPGEFGVPVAGVFQ